MSRRKHLIVSFIFIFLLIFFFKFDHESVLADDKIKIGYLPNENIVVDIDNIGYEGYGYEIFKKIEELSDLEFEFVEIKGDLFDALRTGQIDISGLFYKTDEREAEFVYTKYPFVRIQSSLSTKKENFSFYDDPQSIDGKTVSTFYDNPMVAVLDKYLDDNDISVNYTYNNMYEYTNVETDYYLTYSNEFTKQNLKSVLNLDKLYAYAIATEKNAHIIDEINDILYYIITCEGDFFLNLENKYSLDLPTSSHRGLKRSEVNKLRQSTLTVGFVEDNMPITYVDNKNSPRGIAVDILNKFSKMYGFDVEYFPYKASDPISVYSHCDILISAVGNTQDVSNYYKKTEAYHALELISISTRETFEQNTTLSSISEIDISVGMLNYLHYNFIGKSPNIEYNFFNSTDDLLDSFGNDELDLAIFTNSDVSYVNEILSDKPINSYLSGSELELAINVSNNLASTYLPLINIMLDTVDSSFYEEAVLENSSFYFPELTITDHITNNWYFIAIFIALVVIIALTYTIKKITKQKQKIEQTYKIEPFTNIMSNAYFNVRAQELITNSRPWEYELISFDIDEFRTINSYFSFEKGSKIIKAIADALYDAFKGTNALYTRVSVDHFLIFRKIDEGGDLNSIYTKYLQPLSIFLIGNNHELNFSFGKIVVKHPSDILTELISFADYARIQGKKRYSTTFIEFDSRMRRIYDLRIDLSIRMERALKDNEFFVVYQPKVNLKTLKVEGAEALVRWHPKVGNTIYPCDFIDVFEKNGFISTLDLYVFEEICKFIEKNQLKTSIPVISSNLSAITILDDMTITRLKELVSKYNLNPNQFEIELSDSNMVLPDDTFANKVKALRKLGFKVSIDNFGAKLSSLNRLSELDADTLKLDKTFFDLKGHGKKSTLVVQNVISMAKQLNLKVVAEGVETLAQARWLKKLECDMTQGYYFSGPVDEEAFLNILQSEKSFESIYFQSGD